MDQLFMTDVVIKKNGSQENRVPYSCWPYQELQTHSATIIESRAAARLIKMHRISSRKFHESQRGKRARFQDDRLAKVCHQSSNENNCLIRGREGKVLYIGKASQKFKEGYTLEYQQTVGHNDREED
ncbi:uncharacterized protein LOC117242633 [Bombus vosnesenskii]|uniref:Uncharacterized protein LOC117242633 n=1 Tax=Bombus vosnesenskii TaxID=207650 RepID=A0A6J3LJ04_9HYME|nr:uncharacterized protein LOC117242633 [Bombus vosnesenskii]